MNRTGVFRTLGCRKPVGYNPRVSAKGDDVRLP
jgi:hypothetical protein